MAQPGAEKPDAAATARAGRVEEAAQCIWCLFGAVKRQLTV